MPLISPLMPVPLEHLIICVNHAVVWIFVTKPPNVKMLHDWFGHMSVVPLPMRWIPRSWHWHIYRQQNGPAKNFVGNMPRCWVQPRASWQHTRAYVTKQYNLVPANWRWCLAAGKVTVGLAPHWPPRVTDISGSPLTGSRPRKGRWAPAYALLLEYDELCLFVFNAPIGVVTFRIL